MWWGSLSACLVGSRIQLAASRAPALGHDMVPCLIIRKEHPGRLQGLCLQGLYLRSAHTLWPSLLLWDMCLFPVSKLFSSGLHLKEILGSKQQLTYWGFSLTRPQPVALHRPVLSTHEFSSSWHRLVWPVLHIPNSLGAAHQRCRVPSAACGRSAPQKFLMLLVSPQEKLISYPFVVFLSFRSLSIFELELTRGESRI